MGYNRKKAGKSDFIHYDKALDNNRKKRGHDSFNIKQYDAMLEEHRDGEEKCSTTEKQLRPTRLDSAPKTTEALLNSAKKRDDSAHNTNTLPINELAEEAQRKRIKGRGDGDGFEKGHFQKYKTESSDLSANNYANLSGIINQIDKMWMAAAWNRMTKDEKTNVKTLIAKRDEIVSKIS